MRQNEGIVIRNLEIADQTYLLPLENVFKKIFCSVPYCSTFDGFVVVTQYCTVQSAERIHSYFDNTS